MDSLVSHRIVQVARAAHMAAVRLDHTRLVCASPSPPSCAHGDFDALDGDGVVEVHHLGFRNFTSQVEISPTLFKIFNQ